MLLNLSLNNPPISLEGPLNCICTYVIIKVNVLYLYKKIFIISICYLWKTICSEINFPFLRKFCLEHCLAFFNLLENFKTGISNVNANRNNFLANKTARPALGLNSRPKENSKIAYCSLKKMSFHRTGTREDTKCQRLNNFFEKRRINRKRKAFVKPIWNHFFFSELKGQLAKPF